MHTVTKSTFRRELFDRRHGTGSYELASTPFADCSMSYGMIAEQLGVSTEVVKYLAEKAFPHIQISGWERRHLALEKSKKKALMGYPLFRTFYQAASSCIPSEEIEPIQQALFTDGFRKKAVRINGKVVLIRTATRYWHHKRRRGRVFRQPVFKLSRPREQGDVVWYKLGEGYLLVPTRMLPRVTTLGDSGATYASFRDNFSALTDVGN